MPPNEAPLRSRLLVGAIAGVAGTVAMTALMNKLHPRLKPADRYPLPPREITEIILSNGDDDQVKDAATAAHAGYGAATGALMAAAAPGIGTAGGALAGVAVWGASYFGWIPAFAILKSATRHPAPRNALMIAAHLLWGAATAASIRQLMEARQTALHAGPLKDADSRR